MTTLADLFREVYGQPEPAPVQTRPPRRPRWNAEPRAWEALGDQPAPIDKPADGDPMARYHERRSDPEEYDRVVRGSAGYTHAAGQLEAPTREEMAVTQVEQQRLIDQYGEEALPWIELGQGVGQTAADFSGLGQVRRSAQGFTRGVLSGSPDMDRGWGQGWSNLGEAALNLAGTAGVIGDAAALGQAGRQFRFATPPPARPPSLTRIYRGIDRADDPERSALLGDRWWHTNPEVASTYAPGSEGAHVIPGLIDESTLNLARVDTPPGTMWRAIPVESLPADVRSAFPRSTTHVTTQEAQSAAEAAGYDGITFSGMRDSGFAGAMRQYPGFQTGDEGRVVALFNDKQAVRSPFQLPRVQDPPAAPMPSEPVTPLPVNPTREIGQNGMPIRPTQPFRQSMVGGSDDLAEAAGFGGKPPDAPQTPPPRPPLRRNKPGDPPGVFTQGRASGDGIPPAARVDSAPEPANSNNDLNTQEGQVREMMDEAQPIISRMFDQMRVDRNTPAAGRAGARWGTAPLNDPDTIIAGAVRDGALDQFDVPGAVRLIEQKAGTRAALEYLNRFDQSDLYRNIKSGSLYSDHPQQYGWNPQSAEEMRDFILQWAREPRPVWQEGMSLERLDDLQRAWRKRFMERFVPFDPTRSPPRTPPPRPPLRRRR